jgi:hypothetical protein
MITNIHTCGLKGLCILSASGSPPAWENTTKAGGGRGLGTYAEFSICKKVKETKMSAHIQ